MSTVTLPHSFSFHSQDYGEAAQGAHHQHVFGGGSDRQPGPGQLRRRQRGGAGFDHVQRQGVRVPEGEDEWLCLNY